jgi:endonuclease/exonuclease/phosphatase (EEP) superfamily protein YafD
MGRRFYAALASLFILANLFSIAQASHVFSRSSEKQIARKTLKLLQINVHVGNRQHGRLITYLNQVDPDVLALAEINGKWMAELKGFLKTYPYQIVEARDGVFGIGVFSRIPIRKSKIVYFGPAKVPMVSARLESGSASVNLLFVHLYPPVSKQTFDLRNRQLDHIVQMRPSLEDPFILIGDLNTTPWSYYFQRFVQGMNVRDTQRDFGLQTSWPSTKPWLRIPIDHCLVSPGVLVLERRVDPDVGSDHFPVYVELGV